MDRDRKFLNACERGEFNVIKAFLDSRQADYDYCWDDAIWVSIRSGHIEIVKLLLNLPEINTDDINMAFTEASSLGHIEIIKLILSQTKVKPTNNHRVIQMAAKNGHIAIVQELSVWYHEHGYNIDNIIKIIDNKDNKIDLADLKSYLDGLNMIKYSGRD